MPGPALSTLSSAQQNWVVKDKKKLKDPTHRWTNWIIIDYSPSWDNSPYFFVSDPSDPSTFKEFAPSYRSRVCQIQKLGLDIKGLVSVKWSFHFPFVITTPHFVQLHFTNWSREPQKPQLRDHRAAKPWGKYMKITFLCKLIHLNIHLTESRFTYSLLLLSTKAIYTLIQQHPFKTAVKRMGTRE